MSVSMKGQIDRNYGVRCIFCNSVFSGAGPSDDWGHNTVKCAAVSVPQLRERTEKLEAALRDCWEIAGSDCEHPACKLIIERASGLAQLKD